MIEKKREKGKKEGRQKEGREKDGRERRRKKGATLDRRQIIFTIGYQLYIFSLHFERK